MISRSWSAAGLMTAVVLCGPPPAAGQSGVYALVVDRTIDRVIVPGYAALAIATDGLAGSLARLCAEPGEGTLEAARTEFAGAVTAFSRVELFRLGPARESTVSNGCSSGRIGADGGGGRSRRSSRARTSHPSTWPLSCTRRTSERFCRNPMRVLPNRSHPSCARRATKCPQSVYASMKRYVGSIAASRDGTRVAATSPRGGWLIVWDARACRVLKTRRIEDVCGVAPGERGFVASDGMGRVWLEGEEVSKDDRAQWDNHLVATPHAGTAVARA